MRTLFNIRVATVSVTWAAPCVVTLVDEAHCVHLLSSINSPSASLLTLIEPAVMASAEAFGVRASGRVDGTRFMRKAEAMLVELHGATSRAAFLDSGIVPAPNTG